MSRRGRTEISESLQRPLNDLGIFTKYKNSKEFEIILLVFPRRKELEHEFTLVSPHVGLGNRQRLFMKDHLFWVPFMTFFGGGGGGVCSFGGEGTIPFCFQDHLSSTA